jgi:hypothetical protein
VKGGDFGGDEEEARQEGGPEEKEVDWYGFTLGAAPPSGTHNIHTNGSRQGSN